MKQEARKSVQSTQQGCEIFPKVSISIGEENDLEVNIIYWVGRKDGMGDEDEKKEGERSRVWWV